MESTREVDKLSAQVETLCFDWRRMRSVLERLASLPWWDLRTLTCVYWRVPFDSATGECAHEPDCVYDRSCKIVGVEAATIPSAEPEEALVPATRREGSRETEAPVFTLPQRCCR